MTPCIVCGKGSLYKNGLQPIVIVGTGTGHPPGVCSRECLGVFAVSVTWGKQ